MPVAVPVGPLEEGSSEPGASAVGGEADRFDLKSRGPSPCEARDEGQLHDADDNAVGVANRDEELPRVTVHLPERHPVVVEVQGSVEGTQLATRE